MDLSHSAQEKKYLCLSKRNMARGQIGMSYGGFRSYCQSVQQPSSFLMCKYLAGPNCNQVSAQTSASAPTEARSQHWAQVRFNMFLHLSKLLPIA